MADTATITEFTYGEAIGQIETLTGVVNVVHTDGTEALLAVGGPVYQGDVIATGGDGAVGVVLADQTVFSMVENSQITLDGMVYDAATQQGSVGLTVAFAAFTSVTVIVGSRFRRALGRRCSGRRRSVPPARIRAPIRSGRRAPTAAPT